MYKNFLIWVLPAVLILITGTALAAWQIDGRVLPNTLIGDQTLGLSTQSAAASIVEQQLARHAARPLTIQLTTDAGPTTKSYSPDQLGINYNVPLTTTRLLDERLFTWSKYNPFKVLTAALKDYQATAVYDFEGAEFQQHIDDLLAQVNQPAVDAQLLIMKEGPEIIKAQQGLGISGEKLASEIINRVETLSDQQISINAQVLEPKITAEQLAPLVAQATSILAQPLEINVEGQTFKVLKEELSSWLVYDPTFNRLALNQENVNKYLEGIASQVNKNGRAKEVVKNTDLIIQEGTASQTLNIQESLAAVTEALLGQVPQTTINLALTTSEPETKEVLSPAAPNSNKGKTIKIVLSEQKLYAWEDGKLVKSFYISSGLTGPTPVGNWTIYNKTPVQTYQSPSYYLPNVHWSSWFAPEIAIHEAYWHNNFGNPMSHGCVNTTIGDAEFIYNWAPIGTPVEVVS